MQNATLVLEVSGDPNLIHHCKLTITKKTADVHFTRMHCDQKSFEKANERLLKDAHKTGG